MRNEGNEKKVYVVMGQNSYEGEVLLGVCTDLKKAREVTSVTRSFDWVNIYEAVMDGGFVLVEELV